MKFITNFISKVKNLLFRASSNQDGSLIDKYIKKLDEIHKNLKSILIKSMHTQSLIESKIAHYNNVVKHLSEQAKELLKQNNNIAAKNLLKQKIFTLEITKKLIDEIKSHQKLVNEIITKISEIEIAKSKIKSNLDLLESKNKKLESFENLENTKLSLNLDLSHLENFINEAIIIKENKEKLLNNLSFILEDKISWENNIKKFLYLQNANLNTPLENIQNNNNLIPHEASDIDNLTHYVSKKVDDEFEILKQELLKELHNSK